MKLELQSCSGETDLKGNQNSNTHEPPSNSKPRGTAGLLRADIDGGWCSTTSRACKIELRRSTQVLGDCKLLRVRWIAVANVVPPHIRTAEELAAADGIPVPFGIRDASLCIAKVGSTDGPSTLSDPYWLRGVSCCVKDLAVYVVPDSSEVGEIVAFIFLVVRIPDPCVSKSRAREVYVVTYKSAPTQSTSSNTALLLLFDQADHASTWPTGI
jgi:hypothetical protein